MVADQLEDAARLFEAGVGPLEMVNLRPHWPLSTVKKLHVKLKRDMPLIRDVTTTAAQSWSADARAGLAAFLDQNPEASIAEVASLRVCLSFVTASHGHTDTTPLFLGSRAL